MTAVRQRLGDAAFISAWEEGRANPANVVAAALTEREDAAEATDPANVGRRGAIVRFTHRQRDVLRLMTLGRTDKEIADALYISRPTASKHVAAIRIKLEADSRTAAVATAIRLGLA